MSALGEQGRLPVAIIQKKKSHSMPCILPKPKFIGLCGPQDFVTNDNRLQNKLEALQPIPISDISGISKKNSLHSTIRNPQFPLISKCNANAISIIDVSKAFNFDTLNIKNQFIDKIREKKLFSHNSDADWDFDCTTDHQIEEDFGVDV